MIDFIREQDYNDVIDQIYLHVKDLNKPKYRFLIKKCEYVGIKHKNDPTAYFECSDSMDDLYENVDYYNPKRDKSFNCF